jgi:ribonuclease HIII
MPTAKFKLGLPAQKKQFRQRLSTLPYAWTECKEQYCDYRLDAKNGGGGWLRIKQYTNGTLYLEASTEALLTHLTTLVQGDGAVVSPATQAPPNKNTTGMPNAFPKPAPENHSNRNTLESITKKKGVVSVLPNGSLAVEGFSIGTDESGKGDYFGPLVTAGVLVNETSGSQLRMLGIMDSKKLTATQIERYYHQIFDIVGEQAIATAVLEPKDYNSLYDRFRQQGKNLNHLLAWGHSTVIEQLLERFPECTQAIIDKFAHERFLLSQLLPKGQAIHIYQTPRAEINIGVAAASIVARYQFTTRITALSKTFQVSLPLGAGAIVKSAAKNIVRTVGHPMLENVAKLHFKTTQEL